MAGWRGSERVEADRGVSRSGRDRVERELEQDRLRFGGSMAVILTIDHVAGGRIGR